MPGSGKSQLSKLIAHQKFDDNVLIIDGDTFREAHPRFNELSENGTKDCSQETQQWAGAMVQLFIITDIAANTERTIPDGKKNFIR
ncbi:MAG: zeta toxin family protein [Ostreibacterium sp.]